MRIQKLDIETSNRIAAGEVVDRPYSVIKELCENALDAGATAITVEIEGGGLESMRVVDNGSGIMAEDLPLAFERHATGKIRSGDSLMGIETLGFRGEALCSIAAVSKVEAVSRTQNAQIGSRIEIHGGQIISHLSCGCPEGTAFTVQNLFYNTPARLKFAKSVSAETARISDIMLRIMLANPNVSFRFLNQKKMVMQTPGTGLRDAIRAVYGAAVSDGCIPVNTTEGLQMHGFIGMPDLSRRTRNAQTLIVNGRAIRNSILSNAVAQGFGARLMTGRFPLFVLHLHMPYAVVDVNVHPQKIEVRFTDEQELALQIKRHIQDAWRQHQTIGSPVNPILQPRQQIPNSETDEQLCPIQEHLENVEDSAPDADASAQTITSILSTQRYTHLYDGKIHAFKEPTGIDLPVSVNDKDESESEQLKWEAEYGQLTSSLKPIGQLFDTYLLIQSNGILFIIDQHAAHERLVYDRLSNSYENGEVLSQSLLNPVLVELTYREVSIFLQMKQSFEALGFEIEQLGESGLVVRAVPVLMEQSSVRAMLTSALDLAQTGTLAGSLSLQRERIIRFACRHSIKAGDALTDQEMQTLVSRLHDNENLTCPHGRPIAIRINKRDLEKGFKRIV